MDFNALGTRGSRKEVFESARLIMALLLITHMVVIPVALWVKSRTSSGPGGPACLSSPILGCVLVY